MISNYRRQIDGLLVDYGHAKRSVIDERKNLEKLRGRHADAVAAQHVLQSVAQAVQQSAHEQITKVVGRCLETVFGENAYGFEVEFVRKRGKTEARMWFVRGVKRLHPTSAAGGGVVDVAAFALRLACLLLATPRRRKLLVLDEPLKMVSRNYAPKIRELLLTLSRELKVQTVMVTHDPQLVAGKVVEIG